MPKPSFATHWRRQLAPAGAKFYLGMTTGAGAPRDLANNQVGAIVGTPTWGAGPYGPQLGGFTTSNYVAFSPLRGGQIMHAAYPCWIAVMASSPNSTTDGMALCETNTGAASQYSGIRFNTSGFGGQVSYYSRDNPGNLINCVSGAQSAASDNLPHVWMGLSLASNVHRIFLDGVQVGTSTTNVSTTTFNTATLGATQRSSVILPFAGSVIWGAIGNGAYPDPMWLASQLRSGVFPGLMPRPLIFILSSGNAYTETPSGGIQIGGEASPTLAIAYIPGSGVQVGGESTPSLAMSDSPSGGIQVSGEATFSYVAAVSPEGGIQVSGEAVVFASGSVVITPEGGVQVGGEAEVTGSFAYLVEPSGGLQIGGSVNYTEVAPITKFNDADVRRAVRDLLADDGVYAAYLSGIPEVRGQRAGDMIAVSIEPDSSKCDPQGDDPSGYLIVSSTAVVTVMVRHEDAQVRDEIADAALSAVANTLNGQALTEWTLPPFTLLSSWRWAKARPPERRVTATLSYRYLVDGWANFDEEEI